MLAELLPKSHIQEIKSVASWEKAIELASEPLLKFGFIEETYVKNMIKSVEQNGPYIVLMDYFALPHAEAGNGVNRLGMALLKLTEPVDLKGNPVTVLLVLAAEDADSHIGALREISQVLADEDNYQQFINGSIDDIHQLLTG
ncbi:PTS system, ascorbate-specific IIA component [Amphibacillus marinus]|uniref:Ascorbate-specific PTS system EIIA component n=1 Tax=Amphibacillus marinus TaxID=872970 RepID=A0A1H8QSQ6_9BACI|nr:PTS sugar transporter subunit IIA [Amphibacillus marinus]SEO57232.1 PTS system, ascorbate-specific IIA component [Amphibacillus marinus]